MQSGYYLAFQYNGDETIKFWSKGKPVTADKLPKVNVLYLGADKATAEKAPVHFQGEDGKTVDLDMSGVTFNEGE